MWNPEKKPNTIWNKASHGGLSGRSEALIELEGQARVTRAIVLKLWLLA